MNICRTLLLLLIAVQIACAQVANACEVSERQAQVGNGTMPYLIAGPDNATPPVFLIHGLFAQKEQWRDVLCALADAGYRPVAPDLPGYGKTQGYDLSAYPLESQVQLIGEFAEKIGLRPQHIAGNSMGGAIAALYAKAHPESIRSIAFIGGPLGISPWSKTVKASILSGDNPFIPLTTDALQFELSMLLVHAPALSADAQAAILMPYRERTQHYVQVWNIVNLYDRVLADDSARKLPTLILWGNEDRVFDVAGTRKLADRFPRHRLLTLPDTGHLAMVDSPAEVSRAYIGFLQQISR